MMHLHRPRRGTRRSPRLAPRVRQLRTLGLLRLSVVTGVGVALLVAVAASLFAGHRPGGWQAHASAVVLPQTKSSADAANYYETLSNGQLVSTVAQLVDRPRYLRTAAHDLGLSAEPGAGVTVSAAAVPETAVVTVTAEAPTSRAAEQIADRVLAQATPDVDALVPPYRLKPVSSAAGTATERGLSASAFAVIAALVALVGGAAAQQLVYQLGLARRRGAAATRIAADRDQRRSLRTV